MFHLDLQDLDPLLIRLLAIHLGLHHSLHLLPPGHHSVSLCDLARDFLDHPPSDLSRTHNARDPSPYSASTSRTYALTVDIQDDDED